MTRAEGFVALRAVSKHYGQVKAVDRVSFDIAQGEFFSLLGPSGCGKTTLLRLLGGFETPTGGEIFIDAQPMSGVPANRRPTNMVFQNYAIFPHLSVGENIAFGLDRRALGTRKVAAEVERALQLIKLPGYGERRPHQLSGGQRQRVALARALVRRPKVLLLDEPLGALDKKLREEMQIELRELQRSVGITFVFVTHDQEEALTMSDRIAVMSRGRVLQIDTATRLYESPNCREVAEFIGSMNFIDCEVASVSGRTVMLEAYGIGAVRIVTAPDDPLPTGRAVLALRPEKLQIDGSAAVGEDCNQVRGRLLAQAYLGDRSHYYVAVPGLPKPLAVAAQNVMRVHETGVEPGREITIRWRPEAGVLLPAEARAE
jgi:spermidine/putrescine ABC transporter ATP-binding subunit